MAGGHCSWRSDSPFFQKKTSESSQVIQYSTADLHVLLEFRQVVGDQLEHCMTAIIRNVAAWNRVYFDSISGFLGGLEQKA